MVDYKWIVEKRGLVMKQGKKREVEVNLAFYERIVALGPGGADPGRFSMM